MTESPTNRSHVSRRADYVPSAPQEEFIVPLLKTAIESRLATLVSDAPSTAGKITRVLDAGCGRQPFRHFFETPTFQYHSFDVQTHEDTKPEFIGPLDGDLPPDLVEAAPFDFILCTEVLEHVADWNKAFHNLSRLLSPSGEILVTCPHFYPLHEEPYDFWRPTRHTIAFYAQRHSLEMNEFQALGDSWDILGTLLAKTESPRP